MKKKNVSHSNRIILLEIYTIATICNEEDKKELMINTLFIKSNQTETVYVTSRITVQINVNRMGLHNMRFYEDVAPIISGLSILFSIIKNLTLEMNQFYICRMSNVNFYDLECGLIIEKSNIIVSFTVYKVCTFGTQ